MPNVINATSTGNGGLITQGDDSGILNIQTNETTAITVDASQRVAFVAGTAALPAITTAGDTNTGIYFPTADTIAFAEGGAEVMRITSTGSVFVKTADARIGSDVGSVEYGTSTANSVKFFSNNTEAFRIDSSGSFLVGTTTTLAGPAAGTIQNLTAVSTNSFYTKNSNATPYGIEVQYSGAAPNNTGSPFLECFDTGATRFVARSNGGLANYSANNVNLSDQREKKDIELAPNYLDKICQIPVKTFLFNDQTDTDLNLGAIAQDVQAVCPELVMESNWAGKGEPEKMRLSIYQTDLQYALMKSIQELKASNDTQAETINALTARIVALETA